MSGAPRATMLAVSLALACGATGCTNPDAQSEGEQAGTSNSSPQNVGEPQAPPPPHASGQGPAEIQATPQRALTAFAGLYINWNYRTLGSIERTLAAISIGAARQAEEQAAASSASDSTIAQGHIHNSGQVVSVAADAAQAGTWVIVTRERTGGNSEYEGLPASYHVTLARLGRVQGGYAVSEWLPQS